MVTGGGSGIGRGLVLALAEAGTHVVVADIDAAAAHAVAREAADLGVRSLAVTADVADFTSVEALADAAYSEFGAVHVLCNNAGVFLMGSLRDAIVDDWRWVLGVNVMGVVHGVHAFLPRLLDQGGPAHIVNTSSVAALGGGGVYGTSKAAVVAISESLHDELGPEGIGVSVLLPANVNSRILGAQRNRPPEFGRLAAEPLGTDVTEFGLDPIHVGRRARAAIESSELYVFAFPTGWDEHLAPPAAARFDRILAALGAGTVDDGVA